MEDVRELWRKQIKRKKEKKTQRQKWKRQRQEIKAKHMMSLYLTKHSTMKASGEAEVQIHPFLISALGWGMISLMSRAPCSRATIEQEARRAPEPVLPQPETEPWFRGSGISLLDKDKGEKQWQNERTPRERSSCRAGRYHCVLDRSKWMRARAF
jgi:hypothetical protein